MLDRIAERYGGRKYSNYVLVRCPFHADTHPSMLVYEDYFSCKSCGAKGRTEKLLGLRPKVKGEPATVPRDLVEEIEIDKTNKALLNSKNGIIEDVLARGFTKQDIEKFEIGYINGFYSFPSYTLGGAQNGAIYRRTRLTMPYQKYIIKSPSKLYIPKVMVSYLKGEHVHLFLTFGIMDALTLIKLGYPAISTMSGKNVSNIRLDWWGGALHVIPDKGEEVEAKRLAVAFGIRASVLRLKKHKDPNEYLERSESDALEQELKSLPMWKASDKVFL